MGEEGWNVEAGEVSLWSNEGRGGREGGGCREEREGQVGENSCKQL